MVCFISITIISIVIVSLATETQGTCDGYEDRAPLGVAMTWEKVAETKETSAEINLKQRAIYAAALDVGSEYELA